MYRLTHVYVGLVTGLLVGGSGFEAFLCGVSGAIGGYLPDLDLSLAHRKTLHNFVVPGAATLLVFIGVEALEPGSTFKTLLHHVWASMIIGWVLHVLADSLTSRGVYPFYPLSSFRLRLLKLRSNSLTVNLVLLFLSSLALALWFERRGFIYEWIESLKRHIEFISPSLKLSSFQ